MQLDEQESNEGFVPPEQWPQSGAISIRDLHVRYSADLPPVLHGIDLDITASIALTPRSPTWS
jgi:ABC-type bacteriocin/lantibiotic exporter with double-glycine peptidase domain